MRVLPLFLRTPELRTLEVPRVTSDVHAILHAMVASNPLPLADVPSASPSSTLETGIVTPEEDTTSLGQSTTLGWLKLGLVGAAAATAMIVAAPYLASTEAPWVLKDGMWMLLEPKVVV